MIVKRKTLQSHPVHRKDTWVNESREQLSLTPGTPEYEEYVRDHAGIDGQDYISVSVQDAGEDRRPDDAQKPVTESKHVADLAGDLREKSESQQAVVTATGSRKYRLHMAKEDQFPDAKQAAIVAARQTPGKSDDRRAYAARVDDIKDPVQDDGVSEDDFLPAALRKIL